MPHSKVAPAASEGMGGAMMHTVANNLKGSVVAVAEAGSSTVQTVAQGTSIAVHAVAHGVNAVADATGVRKIASAATQSLKSSRRVSAQPEPWTANPEELRLNSLCPVGRRSRARR